MKSMRRAVAVGVTVLGMALGVQRASAGGNSAEAFERLKSLVGHWEEQQVSEHKATLEIELTSGGSALLERFHMIDDGKPVEMITLYYLDGDKVKLTHYCEAKNQPTMAGTYDSAAKTIKFDFVSATNLKSPNDGHMHHAVYTFIDNDHFKTRWTFRKDQKDAFTEDVTYVRK